MSTIQRRSEAVTRLPSAILLTVGLVASLLTWAPPPVAADEPPVGVPLPATYFTGSMDPDPPPASCPPEGQQGSGEMCVVTDGGLTISLDRDRVFVGESITATVSSTVAGVVKWTENNYVVAGCQDGDLTCTIKPYATGTGWGKLGAVVVDPDTPTQVLATGEAAFNVDAHLLEGTVLIEDGSPPPPLTSPFPWPSAGLRLIRTDALGNPTDYLYNGLFDAHGQLVAVGPEFAQQGFCYFCGGGIDLNGKSHASSGQFRFFLPEGFYKLVVTRYPYHGEPNTLTPLPGWGTPITFEVDEDTQIHLRRDLQTIEGRVTSPSGAPLAGVPILARPTATTQGANATTGADGRYSMLVERGTYEMLTSPERGRFDPTSRMVDVSQDDASGVDFVQLTSRISGWLSSEEGPVRNWEVEAVGPTRQTVRTDEDGRYDMELEPATWLVQPVGGVWEPPNANVALGSSHETASFECLDVEVCGNPVLTIEFEDGPSILQLGEQGTFELTVANRGDVPLTDVLIEGPVPVLGTGAISVESGPLPPLPTELAPGEAVRVSYVVWADAEGDGRYRWSVSGTADGEPVGRSLTRKLLIGEQLEVEVEPMQSEVVLGEAVGEDVLVLRDRLGGDHTLYKVEITVTNQSSDPIENVHLEGGVTVGPVEELEPDELPYSNSVLAVDREDIDLDVPDQPVGAFGTLDPGESSEPQEYWMEALRPGTSPLEAMALGGGPAGTVSASGSAKVKVIQDVLVELRMQLDPDQGTSHDSGSPVKLVGELENLTTDTTIGVFPEVYYGESDDPDGISNATNGYIYDKDTNDGQTPDAPVGIVLSPGQRLDVGAIVATLPAPTSSRAVVTYKLRAFEQTITDDGQVEWAEITHKARVVNDPEQGWSNPVRATLAGHAPEAFNPANSCGDVWGQEFADWTWCGLVNGLELFAAGMAQLPGLLYTLGEYGPWGPRMLAYQARILGLGFSALLHDAEAQQDLVDEALRALGTLKFASNAAWVGLSQQLPGAVAGFLADMDHLYRSGDERFFYELGSVTGQNIDFFVEAPVKAGLKVVTNVVMKHLMKPALNSKVPAAVNRYLHALHAEAAAKIEAGVPIDEAAVPGMVAEPYLDRLGHGRSIDHARKLSDETNTINVYKTRDPLADQLIADGLANPKSEQFKYKSLKQVTIDEFGAPAEWKATSMVMEPPFSEAMAHLGDPRAMTVAEHKALQDELGGLVDSWMAAERPGLVGEDALRLRGELLERSLDYLDFRHNNLPFLEEYRQFGVMEVFRPSTQVGLSHAPTQWTHVAFDYDEAVLPNGRRAWRPKAGTKGNESVPLPQASDADRVFTFDADGGGIASPDKRLKVMEATYDDPLIKSNHGETGSLFDPTGAKVDRWMPSSSSVVLIVAPHEPVRFGRVAKVFGEWMVLDGTKVVHYATGLAWNIPQEVLDGFTTLAKVLATGLGISGWHQRMGRLFNGSYSVPGEPGTNPPEVQQLNRQGAVLNLSPEGELQRFAPTAGGDWEWAPIGYEEAMSHGAPGAIDPAPMTLLAQEAQAGSSRLDVMEPTELGVSEAGGWFQPGDRIAIDPGGPNEEHATVSELGSLVLDAPLEGTHAADELVVLLPDTAPPDTTITSGPGGLSNQGAAEVAFSSDDPLASFECRLDAEQWTPCTSPHVLTDLPDGDHELSVRATGRVGTDPTPAKASWKVDTTPPTVTITHPGSGAAYLQGQVVEADYSCADLGSGLAPEQGCVGDVADGDLIDTATAGPHSFSVTATDTAGNRSTTTVAYAVEAPAVLQIVMGAIAPASGRARAGAVLAGRWSGASPGSLRCGDPVTVGIGSFTETLPGSSFRTVLGVCTYVRPRGSTTFSSVVALDLRKGTFSVLAGGPGPTFRPFVNPVRVALDVGGLHASTAVTFTRHGAVWTYPR
jgi:hypothetical protein